MSNDSPSNDTEKFTRRKHTYRRCKYGKSFDKETSISSKRSTPMTAFGMSNEIPVTEIDSYFPEAAFVFKHQYMNGILNTADRWDNLIDDLEDKAVAKTSSYCPWSQDMKVTYSVPVIGHKVSSNSHGTYKQGTKDLDIVSQHPDWLCWNSVYYNPDYLYELIRKENLLDYKFKYAGPRIMPLPVFDDLRIEKLRFQPSRRCKIVVSINHDGYGSSGSGWKQSTDHQNRKTQLAHPSKYLEIDLRCEQRVTHIGTAGQFPKTASFPTFEAASELCPGELDTLYSIYNQRYGKRGNKHIQIIAPDYIPAYVTAYTVHYFHPKLKTWLRISDVFTGNTNCVDEVVHDLRPGTSANGIYARYFRFEPVSYQTLPIMRVAVYGHDMNKLARAGYDSIAKDIETVKYTITPGRPSRSGMKVKQNQSSSYHDDWYYDITERAEKVKSIRETIKEDVGIFDEDDGSEQCDSSESKNDTEESSMPTARPLMLSDFLSSLHQQNESSNFDDMELAIALSLSEASAACEQINSIEEEMGGYIDGNEETTSYVSDDDYIFL